MPMREYIILDDEGKDTNIIIEHICKNPPPETITSETGTVARLKKVSLFARTSSSWADAAGTKFGVNGFYNRALGVRVSSQKEADKIAESRGLVRMDDYDKHFFDDKMDAIGQEEQRKAKEADQAAALYKQYSEQSWQ